MIKKMVLYKRRNLRIKTKICPTEDNFLLGANTTYHCGGACVKAYFPENLFQVILCSFLLKDKPHVIIGNGSNVLVSDQGYHGYVIYTKYVNRSIKLIGNKLICGASVKVSELLSFCVKNGLSGLEDLAGIPATIGGLVAMNGGIDGYHISDSVVCIKTVKDGKVSVLNNKSCKFAVKNSIMRDINIFIYSIMLHIIRQKSNFVNQKIDDRLQKRKDLPKGNSCGCVFVNPSCASAGKLIDECGLKGFTYGTASVSLTHANFIINHGKAASDVYFLIQWIKRIVYRKCGILLREEVVLLGDFYDFNG